MTNRNYPIESVFLALYLLSLYR